MDFFGAERRLNGGWGGFERLWGFEMGRACFLVEINEFERIWRFVKHFNVSSCFLVFPVDLNGFGNKNMQIWFIPQNASSLRRLQFQVAPPQHPKTHKTSKSNVWGPGGV